MTRNRSRRRQDELQAAGQISPPPSAATLFQLTARQLSGPLPPPEILEHYDTIIPGAAERIMQMAERQAAHRQELEKIAVKGGSRDSLLGIITGGLIGLAGLAGSSYALIMGAGWPAATLGGASLASLAGVFVYGTRSRQKERQMKLGWGPPDQK